MFTVQSIHISMEVWGSVFCLLAVICIHYSALEEKRKKLLMYLELCTALLTLSDSIAWACQGAVGIKAYYLVRISNFVVFEMNDMILMLANAYVCVNIPNSEKKLTKDLIRVKLVYAIGFIGALLVVITQFTGFYYYIDENNVYHRNTWFPLSVAVCLLGMMIDLSLLLQYRKRMNKHIFLSLVSNIMLPILACVALVFYYGISFTNIAITISMIFMFVVAIVEQEKELAAARVDVMLSQIKPHFIYNTLTTIKYLCRHNPEMAAETVDDFSVYLRGNIDSLTIGEMIPFADELAHVKSYLSIEKKRFGERVNVQYDIEESDFMVPTLILQPIVENAVKHGLCKREDGGTVQISSHQTTKDYEITVCDDGVGFDPGKVADDGKVHVGLENVRERVKTMCHGKMEIDSTLGVGTTVKIIIPLTK